MFWGPCYAKVTVQVKTRKYYTTRTLNWVHLLIYYIENDSNDFQVNELQSLQCIISLCWTLTLGDTGRATYLHIGRLRLGILNIAAMSHNSTLDVLLLGILNISSYWTLTLGYIEHGNNFLYLHIGRFFGGYWTVKWQCCLVSPYWTLTFGGTT